MADSDLEAAIRGANPRWLAERDALLRGSRLNESAAPMQPSRIVKDASITPLLYGGGGSSTAFGIADDPNAPPPQTPTFPNPFPDDVTHTPFPEPGTYDYVGLVVHGQDVGYPNSYGAFAADVFNFFGTHSDTAAYWTAYAWQFDMNAVATIGNIRIFRVDAYFPRHYDGPALARFTHSGLSQFFGGPGPYDVYQSDFGPWP